MAPRASTIVVAIAVSVLVGSTTAEPAIRGASDAAPLASFAYWVYCSDCGALAPTPTLVETYERDACWATEVGTTEGKFTSATCSADGKTVTQTYYNDAKCQGATSHVDTFAVGTCQKGTHSYDPAFEARCNPAGHMPFPEWISDAYYVDAECKQLLYTDYHPVGCVENCPNTYSLGVVNTTAYRYDFGCDKSCPDNDYCGNGDLGALNKCVKDEYSNMYRKIHAFV